MKNPVWISLSFSLLASAAQASRQADCGWIQVPTETGVHDVLSCGDGSVKIKDSNGTTITLTKEVVDALRGFQLGEGASGGSGGVPCVGKVAPTNK